MTTLINHITYKELQEWQKENKEFQLIDVREADEHETFNIGGDLIPLSALFNNMDRLETEKPIIFYCKRGIRSQIAIQRLTDRLPTAQFFNLQDGILHLIPGNKAAV